MEETTNAGDGSVAHRAGEGEDVLSRALAMGFVSSFDYSVHLQSFDGPLDLLLFLIRRDEIDVFDIPVAHITGEYLKVLGTMRAMDLDVGGEFVVMATTLLRIKSQMLLPQESEDAEEEDPREELVRRLLEYQRFKTAAGRLDTLADEEAERFRRGVEGPPDDLPQGPPVEDEVTLFHLLDALRVVVTRRADGVDFHRVIRPEVTLEERLAHVTTVLRERDGVPFVDLFSDDLRRTSIVATFVAILELARTGVLYLRQAVPRGDIWVWRIDYGNW
jgi:segregation and condensation protein A